MAVPTTKTGIANLALRYLSDQFVIADLDVATDTDSRTVAIREQYDLELRALLRDYPWTFAHQLETLILLTEDPTENWRYSYHYPSDIVALRSFDKNVRLQTLETDPPREINTVSAGTAVTVTGVTNATQCEIEAVGHELENGDLVDMATIGGTTQLNGNTYIVSDRDQEAGIFKIKSLTTGEYVDSTAYGVYTTGGTATRAESVRIFTDTPYTKVWVTRLVTSVTMYPDDFIKALAYRIAEEAGPLIVGADKMKLVDRIEGRASSAINRALRNGFIEQRKGPKPRAGLAQVRRPGYPAVYP